MPTPYHLQRVRRIVTHRRFPMRALRFAMYGCCAAIEALPPFAHTDDVPGSATQWDKVAPGAHSQPHFTPSYCATAPTRSCRQRTWQPSRPLFRRGWRWCLRQTCVRFGACCIPVHELNPNRGRRNMARKYFTSAVPPSKLERNRYTSAWTGRSMGHIQRLCMQHGATHDADDDADD